MKNTIRLLLGISAITHTYASDTTDFIFAANVPAYVPFESNLHELIELRKKSREVNQPLSKELSEAIDQEFSRLAEAELTYLAAKEIDYEARGRRIKNKPLSDEEYSSDIEFVVRDNSGTKQWRGAYKTYDTTKSRVVTPSLNLEEDVARVSRIVRLFENESFGHDNQTSHVVFKDRMALAILANRPKSVLSVKNQSLKVQHDDSKATVIAGAWAPQWEYRKVKNGHFSATSYAYPRRYVRYCLEKWKTAKTPGSKEKWMNKVIDILEQERNVGRHVPYRELRESLRTSNERRLRLKSKLDRYPGARIYEATHDSDLIGLRTQTDGATKALGLYSYYMKVLREFHQRHQHLPEVATTGYRAVYEPQRYLAKSGEKEDTARTYYAWVYQAIEDDRYARAAAAGVDFRASYIAEPNALYLVPEGGTRLPYSFLGFDKDKATIGDINIYDPKESMLILSQIYNSNPNARILFDPRHPVWMQVPDRMLQYKTSKTDFDVSQFGVFDDSADCFVVTNYEKARKFAAQISQTPFAYRDYATTLYAQFALIGVTYSYTGIRISRPNSLFTSLICSLFNYYEQPQESRTLRITYEGGRDELSEELNRIQNGVQLAALISQIYGHNVGEKLRAIAQKISEARRRHHKAFFEVTDDSPARTSVRSSMERSPQRYDEQIDLSSGSKEQPSGDHPTTQVAMHKYTARDISRILSQLLLDENSNPVDRFALNDDEHAPIENLVFQLGSTYVLPPLTAAGNVLIEAIAEILRHPKAVDADSKVLLVPYNSGGHWVTLRINIPTGGDVKIEYIDSLQNEDPDLDQTRLDHIEQTMKTLATAMKQTIAEFRDRVITHATYTPRIQYNEIDCGALSVANIVDCVITTPLPQDYHLSPDEVMVLKHSHHQALLQMGDNFEFEDEPQLEVSTQYRVDGSVISRLREASPEPLPPMLDTSRSTASSKPSKLSYDSAAIAQYKRDHPNMTQKAIAEYFGCSPSTVSRAINGK